MPAPIEVATYYVVSEAITNAAKHSGASVVDVRVEELGQALRISVKDDGAGGAHPERGSGLVGLRDRVRRWAGPSQSTVRPARGPISRPPFPSQGRRNAYCARARDV